MDDIQGSGGYTPASGGPTPYAPQTGDKFAKSNLSLLMHVQSENLCVPAIMEYINNYICNDNKTIDYYVDDYYANFGENASEDGVELENIDAFVENNFDTGPYRSIYGDIQQRRVVMTDRPSNIPNSTHNVLVVGYHPNGTLIYMDPEAGFLQQDSPYNFSLNYTISIRGCK
jgi:hypothetical protein